MRAFVRKPGLWLGLTAVLVVVGLFVLDGPAAGVVLFVACGTFIGYCFAALAGEHPEDRTAGTGIFGRWL